MNFLDPRSSGLQIGLFLSIGSYVLISWLAPLHRKATAQQKPERPPDEESSTSKSA
jgi:hypothetical protein